MHLGWTYWVANVCGDVPRDVAVRRGRYFFMVGRRRPPKCTLRVYSGIALIWNTRVPEHACSSLMHVLHHHINNNAK